MPEMCPPLSRLDALRELVAGAAQGDLPDLAGELARLLGAVLARTAAPVAPGAPRPAAEGSDVLLGVDEAAVRLGVAPSWLYRHAKALPFARKLGHRTLRFSARGVERWLRTRPAA